MSLVFAIQAQNFALMMYVCPLPNDFSIFNAGALLTVFLCVLLGGFRAASAAPYLEALTTARSAAAKIFRTIERVPSIDSSSESGMKPDKMTGAISFKDVVFSYPSRAGVPILKDFCLEVLLQLICNGYQYISQYDGRYLLDRQLLWLGLLVLESRQLSSYSRGFTTQSQVGTV